MIEKFLTYLQAERHYSAHTINAYRRDLYDFCDSMKIEPSELDPKLVTQADIKSWMVERMDEGITARTMKRKLSTIHSFFRFLLKIKYIEKDVTQYIIPPKLSKPLPTFFKDSEMQQAEQVISYLTDGGDFQKVRDALIIELLYQTGIRRAELIDLKERNVDTSLNQIRVFGKRRKERLIPMGEELARLIEDYRTLKQQLISDKQLPMVEQLLIRENGAALQAYDVHKVVKGIMQDISSQKKLSPHVLRHTFATTMLNHGANINTIKELMGHASLAATQIYTHTTFQQAKAEYKQAHPRAK